MSELIQDQNSIEIFVPTKRGVIPILIDIQDMQVVMSRRWGLTNSGYLYETSKHQGRLLHSLILQAPKGVTIDHEDRNKFNFTRKNLRIVDRVTSTLNARIRRGSNCSSKYNGVQWKKDRNKWIATIYRHNSLYWLGQFESEIEAAKAYDKAAIKYYGKYAKERLNFKDESEVGYC